MKNPLVSIILPVYNAAPYLREALDSIFCDQTLQDLVVLACDDCSTDESYAMLQAYATHEKRLIIVRNKKNCGISSARNRLLSLATSKYFALMDSDDVMHPQRLAQQVQFLEDHPEIDVVGSNITVVPRAEHGSLRNLSALTITNNFIYAENDRDIKAGFLLYCAIGSSTTMIRLKSLRQHNLHFNSDLRYTEDLDLWVRALPYLTFANIPRTLFYYRGRQTQLSALHRKRIREHHIQIIAQHLRKFHIKAARMQIAPLAWPHEHSPLTLQYREKQAIRELIYKLCAIKDYYGYPGLSAEFREKLCRDAQPLIFPYHFKQEQIGVSLRGRLRFRIAGANIQCPEFLQPNLGRYLFQCCYLLLFPLKYMLHIRYLRKIKTFIVILTQAIR